MSTRPQMRPERPAITEQPLPASVMEIARALARQAAAEWIRQAAAPDRMEGI